MTTTPTRGLLSPALPFLTPVPGVGGAAATPRFPAGRGEPGYLDPDHFVNQPSASRLISCWLGGNYHFAADRALADALTTAVPVLATLVRASRRFRASAVHRAAQAGTPTVLDLGAGLPVGDDPGLLAGTPTTMVYVEQDPVAVQLLRSMTDDPHTVVEADLRHPDALLDRLIDSALVDPRSPTLVLLTLVLHHLDDRAAVDLLAATRHELGSRSTLAVTTLVGDPLTAAVRTQLLRLTSGSVPVTLRSGAAVTALLAAAGWHVQQVHAPLGLYRALAGSGQP